MQNIDKKWIKYIIISLIISYIIGTALKYVLSLIITLESLKVIISLIIPACLIMGLLIVLFLYQKEHDNILK